MTLLSSMDVKTILLGHCAWLSGQGGERANFGGADLRRVDLGGAKLDWANFADANLECANLIGTSLQGAHLRGANLQRSYLSFSDLSGANLQWATLESAAAFSTILNWANLRFADLRRAWLCRANLRFADLSFTDLAGSHLWGANLAGTDLSFANLSDCSWDGAYFLGAEMEGAFLDPFGALNARYDLWNALDLAPQTARTLLELFEQGNYDGFMHRNDTGSLVARMEAICATVFEDLSGKDPDHERPIERLLVNIRPGDTPQNNQFAAICSMWLKEYLEMEI